LPTLETQSPLLSLCLPLVRRDYLPYFTVDQSIKITTPQSSFPPILPSTRTPSHQFASDMIEICFSGNSSGESIKLIVASNELIENVKKLLLIKFPAIYRLSYQGLELENGKAMRFYGIEEGSEIQVSECIFKNVSRTKGSSSY
jgi:hypothetical protein